MGLSASRKTTRTYDGRRGRLLLIALAAFLGLCAPAAAAPGDLTLLTTNAAGVKGNGHNAVTAYSADGGRVAFDTPADNLDPLDADGLQDVYVKDVATGALHLASTSSLGVKGDSVSLDASLSADGNLVAFRSFASDLSPSDPDQVPDIYVKNLASGQLTLVSEAGGVKGDQESLKPLISDDGTKVSFISASTTLGAGAANCQRRGPSLECDHHLYVKDLVTGALTLINTGTTPNRNFGFSVSNYALSADGTKVTFNTVSQNLVPGDTDLVEDTFLRDLTTGQVSLISSTSGGTKSAQPSAPAGISPDGSKVAFVGDPSDLAPGSPSPHYQLFVKDAATGALVNASTNAAGDPANGYVDGTIATFSADADLVAFASEATNLLTFDGGARRDAYVKNLSTGAIEMASVSATGEQAADLGGYWPLISRTGDKIVFQTQAANFGDPRDDEVADPNHFIDGYLKQLGGAQPSDSAPPSVNAVPDRAPNAAGWYSADVTIDWQATDNSGSATDPPDTIASTEGADVLYTSNQSCDPSLNCDAGSLTLSIDKTNPAAVLTAPADGATYTLGDASAVADFSCSDALVLASCDATLDSQPLLAGDALAAEAGTHVVVVVATDAAGNTSQATATYEVLDGANESAASDLDAGETLSTGSTPTASDPLETAVTTQNAGHVSITESPTTETAPSGYEFAGQQVTIEAPDGSAADPLVFVFRLDQSALPAGVDETSLQLFRNGVLVDDCADGSGDAAPDPCVGDRVGLPAGDVEITVLTSQASIWNLGAAGATARLDGSTLDYTARADSENHVNVSLAGGTYTIEDTGSTIAPATGCARVSDFEVACPAAGIGALHVDAGAMSDTVALDSPAATTIDGGPGDDRLFGGSGPDVLNGGDGLDTLNGNLGDDSLNGGSSGDTLVGGTGRDALNGGEGIDVASYAARAKAVRVTLDGLANDGALGEWDNVQTENVTGGSAGDTLIGDSAGNALTGAGGADSINGQIGDDNLSGGDGDDVLAGGTGKDMLTGNAGVDLANYASRLKPVIVRLDLAANDGAAGEGDDVRTENVTGGSAADILVGDALANILNGGGGADVLRGLDGSDSLLARDGTSDAALECDGGANPGAADTAVIDTLDPAPSDCEAVSAG